MSLWAVLGGSQDKAPHPPSSLLGDLKGLPLPPEGLEDWTQRPQAGEGELGLLPLRVQGQGCCRAETCQPSRDTNLSLSTGHHPFLSLFPVYPPDLPAGEV